MTKVVNISEWKNIRKDLSAVGFIPTMGALHEGHLELIKKSKLENQATVVSIFVNPTQFNNKADFEKYPITFDSDLEKLNSVGVDYLLYPKYHEMYPDNYRYKVTENEFSKILCGQFRPGHFDGVLTVVMKLLNIVDADRAYFGEKDYQQYQLVKDMVAAFFMKVEIVGCPTIRDENGLALSSRNARLTETGKQIAIKFARTLKQKEVSKSDLEKQGIQVEYLEELKNRRFAAVTVEGVRLIDNVEL